MLLSTNTHDLLKVFGFEKTVTLLKEAGFDAYDMSLFDMFNDAENCPFNKDNYRELAKEMRIFADKVGLPCNQAHAPFHVSAGDEKDEWRFETVVRAMEIASILGAKCIVVHPKQHLDYKTQKQTLWDMNIAFYNRLIPYCEQFNIQVALENMWHYNPDTEHIADSVWSRPEEFLAYLETLNSRWLVACLDIGHAEMRGLGTDCVEMIHALGKERLQALHIHDNDKWHDSHRLPFTMDIDFKPIVKALKDIDYQGDFTLEVDHHMKA